MKMAESTSESKSLVRSTLKHIRKKTLKNFIALKGVKSKLPATKKKKRDKNERVVLLSHIPHGFTEDAIQEYFSQFGEVTNIRLEKSMKSGKTKGYAFIEFEHEVVAQIVAETMNNYVLFNRLLKAKVIKLHSRRREKFWNKYKDGAKLDDLQDVEVNKKPDNLQEIKVNKKPDNLQEIKVNKKPCNLQEKREKRKLQEEFARKMKQERLLISLRERIKQLWEKGISYSYMPAIYEEYPGYGPVPVDPVVHRRKANAETDGKNKDQLVLEVDESDDEIQFMTPPNVIKRKLCASNTSSPKRVLNSSKLDKFKVRSKTRPKNRKSGSDFVTHSKSRSNQNESGKTILQKQNAKEMANMKSGKNKNSITSVKKYSILHKSEKNKLVNLKRKNSNELNRKGKKKLKTSQKEYSVKSKSQQMKGMNKHKMRNSGNKTTKL